jgi:hypothetical protein
VGDREDDMNVVDRQQFLFAAGEPLIASVGLALWTVSGTAGNGDLSITCLMGSIF